MGFEHKKSLGQNFLNSDYVPKKMCDAAAVADGDLVLEIGPGTGALTRELLARNATVIAIETDTRALAVLEQSFVAEIAAGKLKLHHADARKLDLNELGLKAGNFKVVSNIPYYLSGQLLRTCLDTGTQPKLLVFLMQKELVERIARTEKESLLSLSVKVFGQPKYVTTIKRGHFTPAPGVDSAILAVTDISKKRLRDIAENDFFFVLRLGFGQKRKQLQHNLRAEYSTEQVCSAILDSGLPSTVRAEDIKLDTWITLVEKLTAGA